MAMEVATSIISFALSATASLCLARMTMSLNVASEEGIGRERDRFLPQRAQSRREGGAFLLLRIAYQNVNETFNVNPTV